MIENFKKKPKRKLKLVKFCHSSQTCLVRDAYGTLKKIRFNGGFGHRLSVNLKDGAALYFEEETGTLIV